MDDKIISSDDQLSQSSEDEIAAEPSLNSEMDVTDECDENNTVSDDEQVNEPKNGQELPFFLDSVGNAHVAEEIEVETSLENDNSPQVDMMRNYADEIPLTVSPIPTSSREPMDTATSTTIAESAKESGKGKPQIFRHLTGKEKQCIPTSTEACSEDEDEEDAESVAEPYPSTSKALQKPTFSDEDMMTEGEGCEEKETRNDSVSSSEDPTIAESVDSPVVCAAPTCTTEPITTDEETEDDEENMAGMDDKTENDKAENLVVRASCIQWAKKKPEDDQCAGPSRKRVLTEKVKAPPKGSSSTTCDTSGRVSHGKRISTTGACSPPVRNDDSEDEDMQDDRTSHIWIPEITTTTFDEETVHIPIVAAPPQYQPYQVPPVVQNQMPCCYHPCCWMMRELWSCVPPWMNYSQINNSQESPRPPARPPGFEDPPEREWISVNVHKTDPKSGAMRYKCRNCEGLVEYRSTKQRLQLNLSRLKYQCQLCNRKYITKKQLKIHSLRHTEKTKVCSYCDKAFLTQNELQNHMNTHTRERPYLCPVCFQRFAHSSRYYAHIRNFHKKYDCNACYYKECSAAAKPEEGTAGGSDCEGMSAQ